MVYTLYLNVIISQWYSKNLSPGVMSDTCGHLTG